VKVISEPLPSENGINGETRVTIGERQEEVPASNDQGQNSTTGNPSTEHALAGEALTGGDVVPGANGSLLILDSDLLRSLRVEDELKKSTSNKTRSEVSWKVMMQEKLSSHEEEWEVMSSPSKEEETGRVIQTRASS
jgi:hypothetical protein